MAISRTALRLGQWATAACHSVSLWRERLVVVTANTFGLHNLVSSWGASSGYYAYRIPISHALSLVVGLSLRLAVASIRHMMQSKVVVRHQCERHRLVGKGRGTRCIAQGNCPGVAWLATESYVTVFRCDWR